MRPAFLLLFVFAAVALVQGTERLKPHHLPLGRNAGPRILPNPTGEVEVHLLGDESPVTAVLDGLATAKGASRPHALIGHDHVVLYEVNDLGRLDELMQTLRGLEDVSPALVSYSVALSQVEHRGGAQLAVPREDDEWHLGGVSGRNSVNAYAAHSTTKGAGIHVAVTDTVFDTDAAQLAPNHDATKSLNLLVGAGDPNRRVVTVSSPSEWGGLDTAVGDIMAHGTACAGLVAATEGPCARGMAPEASWSGVRLPDMQPGGSSAAERHASMGEAHSQPGVDVWSMSHSIDTRASGDLVWAVNYYGTAFPAALEAATTSVLVAAAGNSREVPCGLWDYQTWPETVMVGASFHTGDPTLYTSEGGGSILVAAPAGRCNEFTAVNTVDVSGGVGYDAGDCTDFCGTSASCPQVAGVIALMQSAATAAGRKLTNREVQLALADSADHALKTNRMQDITTASIRGPATYSMFLGFGVPDAVKAVRAAEEMARSPVEFLPGLDFTPDVAAEIPADQAGSLLGTFVVEAESTHLVQYITGSLTVTHDQALELKVVLANDRGVECNMWGFSNPAADNGVLDVPGPYQKTFKCVPFLGSRAAGTYTITATDIASYTTPAAGAGSISDLTLTIHGYRGRVGSGLIWIMSGAAAVVGVGGAAGVMQQRRRKRRRSAKSGKSTNSSSNSALVSNKSAVAGHAVVEQEEGPASDSALPAMMSNAAVVSVSTSGSVAGVSAPETTTGSSVGSVGSRASKGSKGSKGSRAGSKGSRSSRTKSRSSTGSKSSSGGKRRRAKRRSKSPRPSTTSK